MANKKRKNKHQGLQLPRRRPSDPVERIIQRTHQWGSTAKFVRDQPGQVRMSDVLTDFIEPYVEAVESVEAYRRLLRVAIAAWNTALLPKEKRTALLDRLIESQPWLLRQDFRAWIAEMIERKQAHFGAYDRMIVDFELVEQGDDYHITVASILPQDKA